MNAYERSISRMTSASVTASRMMRPGNKQLCARISIEIVSILILAYPMIHIYVVLQGDSMPYKRGFFCDDLNIRYPLLDNTVPIGTCFIIWSSIVVVLIPLVEMLHVVLFVQDPPLIGKIPWVVIELYRILGYFTLGALCTLLTTEMAKYKIGRLRPHFLNACKPDFTKLTCRDPDTDLPIYVTEFACTGTRHDEAYARRSFLSGHASFSFYCATFLIVYFHARFTRTANFLQKCRPKSGDGGFLDYKGHFKFALHIFFLIKILRPFLQFGFFALAFYICLTRISDYHHHPGDVLAGTMLGIVFAILTLVVLMNLFNRPRVFKYCDDANGDVSLEAAIALNPISPLDNNYKNMHRRNPRTPNVIV